MKMKKFIMALVLAALTSLPHGASADNLSAENQAVVNQAVNLLAVADVAGIVALIQQNPDIASAIYEALAKANPQSSAGLAAQLASALPEQAGAIAFAMISGVSGNDEDGTLSLAIIEAVKTAAPDQVQHINEQVENVVLDLFTKSVAHFDQFNDTPATVNAAQQVVNNIQAAASQGLIDQDKATKAIMRVVNASRGGVSVPVVHPHSISQN